MRSAIGWMLTALAIGGIVLALGSCGRDETPDTVKVGVLPYLSNSILKIALEEGYFKAQGLEVELVPVATHNELIPLLIQGTIDVGTPALSAGLFNSIAQGARIRIVLALTDFAVQSCTATAYVARRVDVESGRYAELSSWKGARMALPTPGAPGVPSYMTHQLLSREGMTLQDLTTVAVDLPAQGEALRKGQVDLIYAVEPWVTRMLAGGEVSVLRPVEPIAPDLTASMIVYGKRLLEDRDIGKRFAVAYLRGVRRFLEGKTDRNVDLVAAYTGLDAALVRSMCWTSSPRDGHVVAQSLVDYQTWLSTLGLLDTMVEPEVFLDTGFAEEANAVLARTPAR